VIHHESRVVNMARLRRQVVAREDWARRTVHAWHIAVSGPEDSAVGREALDTGQKPAVTDSEQVCAASWERVMTAVNEAMSPAAWLVTSSSLRPQIGRIVFGTCLETVGGIASVVIMNKEIRAEKQTIRQG
jgi:hypothetical protein